MSRIILKISGEALKDNQGVVAKNKLDVILKTINILQSHKHQVAIVIGGGNIFRGREHPEMHKVTADTIGMLGTVMNALYIKDYLDNANISNIIFTPFDFPDLIPNYTDKELDHEMGNGKVIIFGGGIGKSGYSTDSGTILAAKKINCDLIIKMTNVDGVYSDDPKNNKDAIKFDYLSYDDVLDNNYSVMDLYAIKECKDLHIKILVMNFNSYDKLNNYFLGEKLGTEIK